MILERRSIPYHYRPYSAGRSYPLNRFSDIIELARLNEAWLLRRVNEKIDEKDGREREGSYGPRIEMVRSVITLLDHPRGYNSLNFHRTAKRKREV